MTDVRFSDHRYDELKGNQMEPKDLQKRIVSRRPGDYPSGIEAAGNVDGITTQLPDHRWELGDFLLAEEPANPYLVPLSTSRGKGLQAIVVASDGTGRLTRRRDTDWGACSIPLRGKGHGKDTSLEESE